jgi:4-hydroxybenzoate polyprenyltransferase
VNIAAFLRGTRAHDWWDFKLLVIVGFFFATLVSIGQPLWPYWSGALLLLIALIAGAVFASIINDWFDKEDDALARKANTLAGKGASITLLALIPSLSVGATILALWRDDLPLSLCYGMAWLAFVAYSVPPLRLKRRAGAGIIAAALGEATLPTLVAVLLAYRSAGLAPEPMWVIAVAVWSLCHGLRAILWHQMKDLAADRTSGVQTFVARHGEEVTRRIARSLIMPLEIVALTMIIANLGWIAPLLALALYACVLRLRMLLWHNVPVVVAPVHEHVLLLQDYYLFFLPASILLLAASRTVADLLVGAVLLALFHTVPRRIFRDVRRLTNQAWCEYLAWVQRV